MRIGLFLLAFLSACFSFSQSFKLFHPQRDYVFGYNDLNAGVLRLDHVVHFDSVHTVGSDTLYYNYTVVDSAFSLPTPCDHTPRGNSWLGHHIREFSNGDYELINAEGDTLRIQTQAPIGATWKFMDLPNSNFVEAEVTSINLVSIQGQLDSAKYIRLQARDLFNIPVPHPLNGKEIRVGETLGLVQGFDFYHLPGDTTLLQTKGMSNPDHGRQNISYRQFFDYDVGDIFHYYNLYNTFSVILDTVYEEWTILSKYVAPSNDTLSYTVHRRKYERIIEFSPPSDTTFLTDDTIMHNYISGDGLWMYAMPAANVAWTPMDQFPGQAKTPAEGAPGWWEEHPAFPYSAFSDWVMGHNSDYNGRLQKRHHILWVSGQPEPCWTEPLLFGFSPIVTYAEGLGMVYNEWDEQFGNHNQVKLVYYQKGSETWGTPINFNVLLDREPRLPAPTVKVYPNPARDRMAVEIDGHAGEWGQLTLHDLQGRIVQSTPVEKGLRNELLVADLVPGIYFYRIQFENSAPTTGKILRE